MKPDFNKTTIDTLAKRAGYKCSNPDCRVNTAGPNTDPDKSITIGEAAHIFGARSGSKRYSDDMTDATRSEITNAIWLCCNCHKLVDSDEHRYTTDLLFAWREQHEKFVLSELGNKSDKIRLDQQERSLQPFKKYPPEIRRIIIDKPKGWEWRLTAELMRYLNNPLFRRFEDLRDGLYVKNQKHIVEKNMDNWIQTRLSEASNLVHPFVVLLDKLNKSWGALGEPGDVNEIHHIVCLIRDALEEIIKYEERTYFTNVPEKYERIVGLLKDFLGSQVFKLAGIPDDLDEIVALIGTDHGGTEEEPLIFKKEIVFEMPENFESDFNKEMARIKLGIPDSDSVGIGNGCFYVILLLVLVFFVIAIL